MSFMGKGVTKSTVLCLLHLSHEMMAQAKDTVSPLQLSLSLGRAIHTEILTANFNDNFLL